MLPSKNDVESAASKKSNSNVKCSLNMNVNISNKKKDDILEIKPWKIFKLCISLFFLVALIILLYINDKKYEMQRDTLNKNIVQLEHQFDKLDRNIKRTYDFISAMRSSLIHNISKVYRNYDNNNNKFNIYSNKALLPVWNQSTNHQNGVIETNSKTNVNSIMMSLMRSENNLIVDFNKTLHFQDNKKALLTSKTQNLRKTKDERTDIDDMLISEKVSRTKRLRRDNGRDKGSQQNKKRVHFRKRDPLVATFIGAIPKQRITNTAQIGPWMKSNRTDMQFSFTKFRLVEDNMSIEVAISGLFMISVQIFYNGESEESSYYVLLYSEGTSNAKRLVTCATVTSNITGEVTCYTSIVTYLQKGDRLSVQQKEEDRLIDLREGQSQIQLVMLAGIGRKTTKS
ncbi:PREDICTED: uncharacterized protein LOC106748074 isoform X2 [Dinoponera quadriceps]|uniref:Uncharacterized protein LOC106748074 isoform X2 n=1 Tax=Dinoponera quadriceps TaxID=609295 RepID=A0A6P3XTD4_DINQU|nr:PREDICTED: uncharacterized protein LOC106748074 isoform X2 [Dinoponera quadriceps]